MKIKKLNILIIGLLVFFLTGCGSTDNDVKDNNQSSNNTNVVEQEDSVDEAKDSSSNKTDAISSDFKKAMDNYEDFMDEYIAFMKKYESSNGTDISLLTDYANYVSKYAEMVEEFAKWENEDMNTAETAYYIEVQTRVSKKLLEALD